MTAVKSVLVVGGEMYLGHLLRDRLPRCGYRVDWIDSRPSADDAQGRNVDPLTDRDSLIERCVGADAIIDLTKLDKDRWAGGDIAQSAIGLSVLWDAARVNGVRRVVTLVSDGVVGFYRRSAVLDHLSVARPDGALGMVGTLAESMASMHAYKYAMSAMCIRMGSCRPEPADERMLSTWISPDDFIRLVEVSLTADYSFEIVYGVSRNARSWWDNANAYRLGYRPLDRAEVYAERLRGQRSPNLIENVFQGGPGAAVNFAGDLRRIP
jgi:uronate dehydrogenase